MTLDRNDYDALVDEAAYHEANIYENYSGRAMYGDVCFGVYGRITIGEANEIIKNALPDKFEDIIVAATSDNLGLDTIYYYPGVKFDF